MNTLSANAKFTAKAAIATPKISTMPERIETTMAGRFRILKHILNYYLNMG